MQITISNSERAPFFKGAEGEYVMRDQFFHHKVRFGWQDGAPESGPDHPEEEFADEMQRKFQHVFRHAMHHGCGPEFSIPSGRGHSSHYLLPALLLCLKRGEAHGYKLLNDLEEFGLSFDLVDASMIYRTLRQLEKDGLVTSHPGEQSMGPQRRIYTVTAEGESYLEMWIEELKRNRRQLDLFLQAYEALKNKPAPPAGESAAG
jgi:PadR family transcriptional regulator, regulatory protein PadR